MGDGSNEVWIMPEARSKEVVKHGCKEHANVVECGMFSSRDRRVRVV